MPEKKRRSPARLLAPIALVAFAVALLLVLGGSEAGNDDDGGNGGIDSTEATTGETATETSPEEAEQPRRRMYTVKAGDNLDLIADKTGVPVEALQELNPEVDPQALVIGQTIKLRE